MSNSVDEILDFRNVGAVLRYDQSMVYMLQLRCHLNRYIRMVSCDTHTRIASHQIRLLCNLALIVSHYFYLM